jgi:hypothetical protein
MPDKKDPAKRDFKYGHVLSGTPKWEGQIANFKTEYLKPWLLIFESHMNRTANLAVMPTMIAASTRRDQVFQSNAVYRAIKKGDISLDEWLSHRFTPEMIREMENQLRDFDARPNALDNLVRGHFGIGFMNWHLDGNAGMQSGMDAILASILMESWTAFESLVSDIWVTVLDQGPKSLANKVALYKDFKKNEPITPKALRELEYDARKEFGKFLRETQRVQFSTLESIKNSYSIAFGQEAVKLFDTTNEGYIEAVSAFRNIFAHKLGKADKKFVGRVERFTEYSHIQSGDLVELDGQIVSKLRDAAVLMGFALVKLVDDYILANPV